ALIANYLIDKGSVKMFDRGGKSYVEVVDYKKMHEQVGELLAEIMRMKGEGDYNGLKALIDKYGVHFDPKQRDQVVQRYAKLNTPAYWAGINAQLTARESGNKVEGVDMIYPRDVVYQ